VLFSLIILGAISFPAAHKPAEIFAERELRESLRAVLLKAPHFPRYLFNLRRHNISIISRNFTSRQGSINWWRMLT